MTQTILIDENLLHIVSWLIMSLQYFELALQIFIKGSDFS